MREFAGWRVWELGGATLSYWDIKFVEYVWQLGRETGRDQIMKALLCQASDHLLCVGHCRHLHNL